MTRVSRPDGSAFLIDRTEVTNAQYEEFLHAEPKPVPDPLLCPDAPRTDAGSLGAPCKALLASDAGTAPDLPRVCVDWCDAQTYCAWAGKSLCRDTSKTLDGAALQQNSDFFAACTLDSTASATPVYSCGSGCRVEDCNGKDSTSVPRVLPVGSQNACHVGPDACSIADLSGNVEEWTGGCVTNDSSGNCVVRGGYFDSSAMDLECSSSKAVQRTKSFVTLGFRCCVDPYDG